MKHLILCVSFCLLIAQPSLSVELDWKEDETARLAEGVRLFQTRREAPLLAAHYLDVDLSSNSIRIKPYLFSKKKTVLEAAQELNAVAAINAGYFGGKVSVSYVVDEGKIKARNLAAVNRNGKSYPVMRGLFYFDRMRTPHLHWVYSFDNSLEGLYSFPKPLDYEPRDLQPKEIPEKRDGTRLRDVECGIGGGPMLVTEGSVNVTNSQEVFWDSGVGSDKLNPRTAIGYTKDKHVILLVVDGRQPEESMGVTLLDLATIMKDIGCVAAMNLDGGGSTQMATSDSYLNSPSERRPVVSILAIEHQRP